MKEQKVLLDNGEISGFQVVLSVTFVVDEEAPRA